MLSIACHRQFFPRLPQPLLQPRCPPITTQPSPRPQQQGRLQKEPSFSLCMFPPLARGTLLSLPPHRNQASFPTWLQAGHELVPPYIPSTPPSLTIQQPPWPGGHRVRPHVRGLAFPVPSSGHALLLDHCMATPLSLEGPQIYRLCPPESSPNPSFLNSTHSLTH